MPPRGSLQDRVICELLIRERRRHITSQVYIARILASGLQLAPAIFDMWTSMFSLEVSQESYTPAVIEDKKQALKSIEEVVTKDAREQTRVFTKLESLTAKDEDMRPATDAEREAFKRKLRKRHLKKL